MKSSLSKFFYSIVCASLLSSLAGIQPVYAASLVVNTNADNTTTDGSCTLREAITNANNDAATYSDCTAGSGTDTITFAANYIITLSGSQLPAITSTVIINGNGATNTILQANATPNTATNRIFEVVNTGNLTLNSLTVRNGRCNETCPTPVMGAGGGILNIGGMLSIINSTISGNSATDGGGIANFSGSTMIITDSTFSANSVFDYGGGIYISGTATGTITNSMFSNNLADTYGGGIYKGGNGLLTVTNSTFSDNVAYEGGGIAILSGTLTVINSTLSANSAYRDYGGGIYNQGGTLTIINSTLSANSAPSGGGIAILSGTATLYNTIVANSPSGSNCVQAGGTLTADSFNIDTDGSCDNATQVTSSQINLQPLANNGGPTQTIALGLGSLAIDVGNPTACTNAPVSGKDQRGVSRSQGMGCDVGAFEYTGNDTALTVISSNPPANSIRQTVTQITVTYNKAVLNDGSGNAANNTANYLLVEQGVNDVFDTQSCQRGRVNDDTQITVNSATYNSLTYTSTLNINSGTGLPDGTYRLFVCGTTSIYDLIGLELNGGLSDTSINFTIQPTASSLPNTGFAPNHITSLVPQSANLAYSNLGDIWLEIPALNVKTSIVGVPKANNTWDVSWLGNDTGWLNGTAFPSWEGNSVLTAHVTNSNGLPGPFANIKNLKYGNQIIIHIYGEKYIFEIRNTRMVRPNTTQFAFQHLDDYSYLTLITCQGYNPISDSYLFRRIIRAVLVDVQSE